MSSKRSKDASTDSLDVAGLGAPSTTPGFETLHGLDPARPLRRLDTEANIILIAHPEGHRLGSRFRLAPGSELVIGREQTAAVSLPEVRSISRLHARLRYAEGRVTLEDLGSTNGTLVNDRPIDGATDLRSGDRFQVGSVHFKFLHEQDPEHAYHEAIYEMVVRDGLTEIFNQRKYLEEVEREYARAVRHRRPLCLILFDIDHFKAVNDNYGHLCGDALLKQLVALAAGLLRPEQIFARVGGEEFVILSPESNVAGGEALAEKLRSRCEAHRFSCGEGRLAITCSFGVAELQERMKGPEDLFLAADRALYQAKREGRNRVCVDSGSGEG